MCNATADERTRLTSTSGEFIVQVYGIYIHQGFDIQKMYDCVYDPIRTSHVSARREIVVTLSISEETLYDLTNDERYYQWAFIVDQAA